MGQKQIKPRRDPNQDYEEVKSSYDKEIKQAKEMQGKLYFQLYLNLETLFCIAID